MRLASYEADGRATYGLVTDGGLVDLGRHLGGEFPTLRALIAGGGRDRAAALAGRAADHALDRVRLLPPIPDPEKILCIGVNYANRNEEYRDGAEAPRYPSLFMRTPDSLTGHGCPILRPPESEQLDYEGEIVMVVGRGGRRISEAEAEAHVFGLTIMNEGSVRDWLRHGKFNVTQGKNFFHSGAMGPWIATADSFPGFDDLTVTTRVNGERRQHDTTANLMFPFRFLISYLSTFMVLKPGDVIATGTPLGAGARFDPPRYLVPGDVVEVEVPGVGVLRNRVEDEA
ncbi:MAG: fumarylacetoacetate hydrolase family protein [Hyphomicrobiales bacterium]|nr:fumarylacetoacetate hydrolase family protein [Hyphomicrobiales bacterium]